MSDQYNKSQYFYYRREWLNPPGQGNAFIEAEVGKPERPDTVHAWYDGGNITIKDCSRQINLSFPIADVHTRENSLRKIAIFLEIIEQFQTFILHAANLAEKAEAARNAKRVEQDNKQLGSDECDCAVCAVPSK